MIYIPEIFYFELNKYLEKNPPEFNAKPIFFYYIIYYIARKHNVRKKQKVVALNLKYLAKLLTYNIDKYIVFLKNGEFIIQDKEMQKGKLLTGYRLNEKYLGGLEKVEIPPHTKLWEKLVKRQRIKKSHYNRLPSFLKQMKNKFMEMDLDYDKAENWILENNQEKGYHSLVALSRLADPRSRNFHRNTTNKRLDTNLTSLCSDLRQFIKGDLVSIDLKNSQPFFLGQLINTIDKYTHEDIKIPPYIGKFSYSNILQTFGKRAIDRIHKIRQSDEIGFLANLSLFNNAVLKGRLYDEFTDLFDGNSNRDIAKENMFKLLFSRNENYKNGRRFIQFKKEKEAFASVYPAIAKTVEILKHKNHALLAIYLQKMESFVFIDCIAKRLVEEDIVPLTIHDSIIVKSNQVQKTIQIVKDEFLKTFGVTPSFHVKPLKNNKNE